MAEQDVKQAAWSPEAAARTVDGCRIAASSLSKTYRGGGGDVEVLRAADFSVEPGERVAILGVSGTGKSTLLNVLGGIDRPDSGSLLMNGCELVAMTDPELTAYRRSTVGFVFQFYNLIPSFTALENVVSALEAAGRYRRGDEEHARHLLSAVGLAAEAEKFPEQLSGGEQQRVAIARALVKSPPLILADEPTGNLDPDTGERVLAVLFEQARLTGATLLVVTHNPSVGERADRRLALERGQLRPV